MDITHSRNVKGGLASPTLKAGYKTYDYFKFYRKNKGSLDKSDFSAVLRECNKAVVEEITETAEEYVLPAGMGKVSFRKRKNKVVMTETGIKSNALVDWKKTMDLWESDPLAKRNKILVRYTNMHTGRYSIRITIFSRKFFNREYFAFRFKRSFKRALAKRILTYNKNKIEVQIAKTI